MNFDLQPYHIIRPEKVEWWWAGGSDLFAGIRSKSLRSFLRKTDEVLAQKNIVITYKAITQEEFSNWLPYYESKMKELDYDIFAKADWYEKKVAENKTVEAIFAHQDNILIGSGILTRSADTAVLNFKASDRIDLASQSNSSLGSVIDFLFLRTMIEQGLPHISSGISRNAFGAINSLGYLDYKLKLGFDPKASPNHNQETSVPLDEAGEVVFYGLENDQPAFFRLMPSDSQTTFDAERLKSLSIPFKEIRYEKL